MTEEGASGSDERLLVEVLRDEGVLEELELTLNRLVRSVGALAIVLSLLLGRFMGAVLPEPAMFPLPLGDPMCLFGREPE